MTPFPEERPDGRPLTIAGQLRVLIFVLAVVLIGILGGVSVEVHAIRADLRQVAEERREADLAQSIVLDVRGFERVVRLRAAAPPDADASLSTSDQLGHLDGAIAALLEMGQAPSDDPSDAEHSASEARARGVLLAALREVRATIERGDRATQSAVDAALNLRRMAEGLALEIRSAASEAATDLDAHGGHILRLVGFLAAGAFVLLTATWLYVRRSIVRPLRDLAEGARRIGRGQLGSELPEAGGDEVRELSREITAMARQLSAHHDELSERVEQRTRELVRSARLADLGAVAAGLAHEINNPLASIVACAEGLLRRAGRDGTLTAEQREEIATIAAEAERIQEIAASLLEIARPTTIDAEPVDVADATRAIVTLTRHRFAERRIALRVEIEPDLPYALSNRQELRQVLLNLLNNALDATPIGGEVTIQVSRAGAEIALSVQDTGPGVSQDIVDRIFDPFFTTKEVGQGTGLGLTIVQRIVERQGGTVEIVDRRPGACFRIRLPIAVG